MRTIQYKLILTLVTLLVASLSQAAMDRNSFLKYPAPDKSTLLAEVKSDPVVMSRFMRHFGMTRQQVLDYIDTLHLDALKEDGVYLVYNTPDWGEIRARTLFFKKGMPIWADPQGNPILRESCGNPMVRGSDSMPANVSPSVTPKETIRDMQFPADTVPVDVLSDTLPVTVDTAPQAFATVAPAAASQIAVPGFNPLALAPLALIPLIHTPSHNTPPTNVPEPMSVLAIAGCAGIVLARRKRTK